MKLSELITAVGDENVEFQRLDDCLVSSTTNRKGVTKITFGTEAISTNELIYGGDKAKKLCLIIFLPKEKLPKS